MAQARASIVFGLPGQDKGPSKLEEEREKHRTRAERFGVTFTEPGKRADMALEAKRERSKREGFKTGMDIFSQEETDKRKTRAERFHLPKESIIAYAPDPEDAKRRQRADKFGTEYKETTAAEALMDVDLFEERKDVDVNVSRRPEAVYLYGVDLMSTNEVLGYFADYGPTFVEWINDSSCCVVFEDEASAARAIVGTGHPLPVEDNPDSLGQSGLDPTSVSSLPFLWHKGRDFAKGGTKIALMYRMATEADVRDYKGDKKSRFLWKEAGSGGRGRGRGRGGRTKGRGRGGEEQQQQPQQPKQGQKRHVDADGDVDMKGGRRERGGRGRGGKRRRGLDGGIMEVDMEDAQAMPVWDDRRHMNHSYHDDRFLDTADDMGPAPGRTGAYDGPFTQQHHPRPFRGHPKQHDDPFAPPANAFAPAPRAEYYDEPDGSVGVGSKGPNPTGPGGVSDLREILKRNVRDLRDVIAPPQAPTDLRDTVLQHRQPQVRGRGKAARRTDDDDFEEVPQE